METPKSEYVIKDNQKWRVVHTTVPGVLLSCADGHEWTLSVSALHIEISAVLYFHALCPTCNLPWEESTSVDIPHEIWILADKNPQIKRW